MSRLQRKSSGRGGKGRGRGKTERESGLVVGRGEQETSELRRELDVALRELSELRERKSSLERECVIYQSQLEVRMILLVLHFHAYVYITCGETRLKR